MEPRKRKILVLCLGVAALGIVAVFLMSNPMMDWFQRRIDANPGTRSARWLQMATADVCAATLRPELAAPRYWRFYERYTQDVRRAHALLRYAQMLEEAGRAADAVQMYQKYLRDYPALEGRSDAEQGINRIRLCSK